MRKVFRLKVVIGSVIIIFFSLLMFGNTSGVQNFHEGRETVTIFIILCRSWKKNALFCFLKWNTTWLKIRTPGKHTASINPYWNRPGRWNRFRYTDVLFLCIYCYLQILLATLCIKWWGSMKSYPICIILYILMLSVHAFIRFFSPFWLSTVYVAKVHRTTGWRRSCA